jgi:head-tail adaptor
MSRVLLNRKLILEEQQTVPDGAGGYATHWVALGTVWAEVKMGAGRERYADPLTVSQVLHRVTVRAAPSDAPSRPRATQRFRDGNRVFRILAVSERDALGRYLICLAQEETGA